MNSKTIEKQLPNLDSKKVFFRFNFKTYLKQVSVCALASNLRCPLSALATFSTTITGAGQVSCSELSCVTRSDKVELASSWNSPHVVMRAVVSNLALSHIHERPQEMVVWTAHLRLAAC